MDSGASEGVRVTDTAAAVVAGSIDFDFGVELRDLDELRARCTDADAGSDSRDESEAPEAPEWCMGPSE